MALSHSTSIRLSSREIIAGLPTATDNARALEFIGLTADVAHMIAERYRTRPDPSMNPYGDILGYIDGHISLVDRKEALNPRHAMNKMGIASWLQDALLLPEFRDIYNSNSLHHWLRDTFKTAICNLEYLIESSEDAAKRVRPRRSAFSHPHPQSVNDEGAALLAQPPV